MSRVRLAVDRCTLMAWRTRHSFDLTPALLRIVFSTCQSIVYNTMSSSAIATVNDLKEALNKEMASPDADHTERIVDILTRLNEQPMTLPILTETLIGASVSKVKSGHPNADVAAKANALVKKWKKLAKEGGVGAASSAGKPGLERGESSASVASSSASGQQAKQAMKKKAAAAAAAAAESGDGPAAGSVESEFAHLPNLRKNISVKMHTILIMSKAEMTAGEDGFDATAIDQLALSRAGEVENAIQTISRGEKSAYMDKARSLTFNLKKNADLRQQVLLGQVSSDELVKMSPDQLAPAEKAKARDKMVEDLRNSRRLDWEQANEKKINEQCGIKGDLLKASLFTCGRCKSHKTTSTQKQTRSADEPMTVFVLCLNCGNRWKC